MPPQVDQAFVDWCAARYEEIPYDDRDAFTELFAEYLAETEAYE